MEEVAEGLWALAEHHEQRREVGKPVKCLEAICQSPVPFLPIVEIKTRLRVAALLLKHSHNVNHAKSHLERAQLLLKSIPSGKPSSTAILIGRFPPTPGTVGELWLRSLGNMKGYLNNINATTAALDKDGWLYTGDIVYFDKDGYFYIIDRLKEVIKYKGFQSMVKK